MTPDEVLAMTDEELRIKAAELMGWTDIKVYRSRSGRADVIGGCPGYVRTEIPNYPHDIAAAWELVERARDDGWTAKLDTWNVGAGPVCQCVFDRSDANWDSADASMPRAITRAFVLAMTQEES